MTKDSKLLKRPIQLSFDTILVLIKNKNIINLQYAYIKKNSRIH